MKPGGGVVERSVTEPPPASGSGSEDLADGGVYHGVLEQVDLGGLGEKQQLMWDPGCPET